jgi:hypothetical protein
VRNRFDLIRMVRKVTDLYEEMVISSSSRKPSDAAVSSVIQSPASR